MVTRWKTRLCAALALVAVAVVGAGGGDMSGSAEAVFELIDVIETARVFAPAEVAALTRASLELVHESAAQRRFESTSVDHPDVESVEIRVPGPAGAFGGLVILEVAESVDVSEEEVLARYETEPELGVPAGGPGEPVYLTYCRDWGELSYGFSRAGVLMRIVLNVDAADPNRGDSDARSR